MSRHGRSYYVTRAIVRVVVLGGGTFCLFSVLPALVDHLTF